MYNKNIKRSDARLNSMMWLVSFHSVLQTNN